MNRRKILKYTVLVTGAAVGAPLMGSLFISCNTEDIGNDPDYQLQFFNNEEFKLIKELIDTIIPKTDSPAATEVGVHKIIDTMVGTVYNQKDKENYQKEFASLVSYCKKAAGNRGFIKMNPQKKIELLQKIDLSIDDDEMNDIRQAYLAMKQQTVAYYLSTEEIGKNYLNYLPVPGKYEACISLDEVGGKSWAL